MKNRRPFKVTAKLRINVEVKIREILEPRKEIVLAVLFGSFIKRDIARDVDLAVYIAREIKLYEALEYSELLGKILEREIGLPFDIIILNTVGEGLLMRAILRGKKILVRDPLLYYGLRMLALEVRNRFLLYH